VTGYAALADVYEWLVPDAMLSPAGSVAAFADVLQSLPPNARVLDCSCGTGQLAVGLAGLGLHVVASDASSGMVLRTRELAEKHDVWLRVFQAGWSELLRHLEPASFDLVMCVGNSLTHAEGAAGRRAALTAMSRLLEPGGRLVLTSRTWELVRARGSRLESETGSSGAGVVTGSSSTTGSWSICGMTSITWRLLSHNSRPTGRSIPVRSGCPSGRIGMRNSWRNFRASGWR
jgi:SAM-dependent methyltransferase